MTPSLTLGLVFAVASAAALNSGFFIQHGAAAVLPPLSVRDPLHSLRILFASGRWLIGFLTGLAGWALYVTALALAPLALVQAASAGGIGLLALLVWRSSRIRLRPRERDGVAFAIAGLVLLAVSLARAHTVHPHASSTSVVVWLAMSAAVALAAMLPDARAGVSGAAFGVAAGVLYAAGDVATKAATLGGTRLAFVPAVLAFHGLAFVSLQLGFQRGGALATAGVATLFTNALPIAAGTTIFHEAIPGGVLGVARIGAFVAVVAGATALARPGADVGSRVRAPSPTAVRR